MIYKLSYGVIVGNDDSRTVTIYLYVWCIKYKTTVIPFETIKKYVAVAKNREYPGFELPRNATNIRFYLTTGRRITSPVFNPTKIFRIMNWLEDNEPLSTSSSTPSRFHRELLTAPALPAHALTEPAVIALDPQFDDKSLGDIPTTSTTSTTPDPAPSSSSSGLTLTTDNYAPVTFVSDNIF